MGDNESEPGTALAAVPAPPSRSSRHGGQSPGSSAAATQRGQRLPPGMQLSKLKHAWTHQWVPHRISQSSLDIYHCTSLNLTLLAWILVSVFIASETLQQVLSQICTPWADACFLFFRKYRRHLGRPPELADLQEDSGETRFALSTRQFPHRIYTPPTLGNRDGSAFAAGADLSIKCLLLKSF